MADIYASALQQYYTDRDGVQHRMTPENILVVAPYNAGQFTESHAAGRRPRARWTSSKARRPNW